MLFRGLQCFFRQVRMLRFKANKEYIRMLSLKPQFTAGCK